MEPQQQQLPQYYHHQYQQPYNDPNSTAAVVAPLSYDPSSHLQSYDQQHQQQQQQQPYYTYDYSQSQSQQPQITQQSQHDYSSYYYPDYSNSYQTQHVQSDPNSIHPPGVPIAAENQQQLYAQNAQNEYYQHGVVPQTQTLSSQGYMLPGHSTTYSGARGAHGGGRGRGRGRGGMHKPKPAPVKPPPQKAWCELCKVDCNTQEILQQHLNGKKHKKNLKVQEELQNMTQKKSEIPAPQPNPAEVASGKAETPKPEPSSSDKPLLKKDRLNGKRGLKRDIKGGIVGRGGKRLKPNNGPRKPISEPPNSNPNPNLRFPVICELCKVKCESQVVYDSHIAGKKHLANVNQFGHKQPPQLPQQQLVGSLQALYPTIPSTSILAPQLHQGPQDAQSLAAMILSQQNLQDPQAAQAALAELLNQHGIHDAQTLLIQLIPYLLTQSQVPGLAGLGVLNAQNAENQGAQSKPEEQNVVANVEAQEAAPKTDNKVGDANES